MIVATDKVSAQAFASNPSGFLAAAGGLYAADMAAREAIDRYADPCNRRRYKTYLNAGERGAGNVGALAVGSKLPKEVSAFKRLLRWRQKGIFLGSGAPKRTVLSGHGKLIGQGSSPIFQVPEGTSVTVYGEHGTSLYDDIGNMIELGDDIPASMLDDVIGAHTNLPGSYMPDYTLLPPYNPTLNIMGNPTTVNTATNLSQLVHPNQGILHWAACLINSVK